MNRISRVLLMILFSAVIAAAQTDKQVNVIALAVGKLYSARLIEAGCRINSGHAGSVRCVREILVRCEAVADCEDDEEKPRINRE